MTLGADLPALHHICATAESDAAQVMLPAAYEGRADAPCDENAMGDIDTRRECCQVEVRDALDAPKALLLDRSLEQLAAPVLVALSGFSLPNPGDHQPREAALSHLPTPPPPASLHILHATFLN